MARHLDGPVIRDLIAELKLLADPATNAASLIVLTPNEYRALQKAINKIAYENDRYPYPIRRSFESVWSNASHTWTYHTDISDICWILDWIFRDPTLPLAFRLAPHMNYLPTKGKPR